jgi:hypothetical protein
MNPKVLLAVLAALLAGAIGYWIGGRQLPPPLSWQASCAATAKVDFDPATKTFSYAGNAPSVEAGLFVVDAAKFGTSPYVCWQINITGSGQAEFKKLRLETAIPIGLQDKPILAGSKNFMQGGDLGPVLLKAVDTPRWKKVPYGTKEVEGVRWKFGVTGTVTTTSGEVPVSFDPEIVIKKGG